MSLCLLIMGDDNYYDCYYAITTIIGISSACVFYGFFFFYRTCLCFFVCNYSAYLRCLLLNTH